MVCPLTQTVHFCLLVTEYFLEDCIQMTGFVPPPMDRKRRDKDEEGGDDDVHRADLFWTGSQLRIPV